MDEILTLKEIAAFLKVAEKTVYTLAQRGDLPTFKVGEQWRCRRQDLDGWISARSNGHTSTHHSADDHFASRAPVRARNEETLTSQVPVVENVLPHKVYRFGLYEIDEHLYQLRHAGTRVVVEPKVFDLLAYLMQHRYRVVSKEELLSTLWPAQIVTESSLTHCITKARRAVRNGVDGQPVIQTHYGRGYRFTAEVTLETGKTTPPDQMRECSVWRMSSNPEAYDYYLCGGEYFARFTLDTLMQARQMYERATTLDCHFAAAYAALAWTYWIEWSWFWSADGRMLERALTLARHAVRLDSTLPMTHVALGYIYLFKRQYARALAALRHSITLDPHYAWGHCFLADALTGTGQPQEAITLLERAMKLEPRSAGYFSASLGFAYRAQGRHDEAIAAIQRTLIRNPDFVSAHLFLTIMYGETGQTKAAKAALARLRQQVPRVSLTGIQQRLPFKNPAETTHVVNVLRQIGLR